MFFKNNFETITIILKWCKVTHCNLSHFKVLIVECMPHFKSVLKTLLNLRDNFLITRADRKQIVCKLSKTIIIVQNVMY